MLRVCLHDDRSFLIRPDRSEAGVIMAAQRAAGSAKDDRSAERLNRTLHTLVTRFYRPGFDARPENLACVERVDVPKVPRGFRVSLRHAMGVDGWPDLNPAGHCDICAALRAGYVFSAAHLLQGATECPNTTECLREWGGMPKVDGWPIDWEEWTEWFRGHTVQCPKCQTFCFTDISHPSKCSNCLAEIPEPSTAGVA